MDRFVNHNIKWNKMNTVVLFCSSILLVSSKNLLMQPDRDNVTSLAIAIQAIMKKFQLESN